jgi:hypothetical protein
VQCNRCRAPLPPGVPSCPYCANPTPYNVSAPPFPPPTSYGQPPYAPPQVPYGQPVMAPIAVQPRKQSGCSTAVVIALVILLVLVCGGSLLGGGILITQKNAAATVTSMNDDATATADDATYTAQLTPTPYPPYTESQSPSGATFSEAAQQVIPNAQLASAVDSSYRPTELQSTFRSGQEIYLVYKWAAGNTGYVQTRWYLNGERKDTNMSKYINQNAYGYGYMGETFYITDNTSQGTIEVFWCQDAACAHGGFAWARPFSVTAS